MKITQRLKDFISLVVQTVGFLGGIITVLTLIATYGPTVFEQISKRVSITLDYFFPALPLQYQILNLLTWLLFILFYIAVWAFAYFSIRKTSKIFLNRFAHHILLDLQEGAIEVCSAAFDELFQKDLTRVENKIDNITESIKPIMPLSAITGDTCPIPGLYKIQEKVFNGFEKTFAKNDTFPAKLHPQTKKEEKVTWIYQHPQRIDITNYQDDTEDALVKGKTGQTCKVSGTYIYKGEEIWNKTTIRKGQTFPPPPPGRSILPGHKPLKRPSIVEWELTERTPTDYD